MQFFSIKPLIDKFQQKQFKDEEVAPYFIAYAILESLIYFFPVEKMDSITFLQNASLFIIMVFGIFYLKKQNNNSFGNGFLNRWFALGWVISVRTFFIYFPIGLVLVLFELNGDNNAYIALTIFGIFIEVIFYLWLGQKFKESQAVEEV